ncbi:hypothetical protein ACS0TY_001582 [Phlomoides rotata]
MITCHVVFRGILRFERNTVIEWCTAEHKAFESQGIFFDNKCTNPTQRGLNARGTGSHHRKHYSFSPSFIHRILEQTFLQTNIYPVDLLIIPDLASILHTTRDRLDSITEGGQVTAHLFFLMEL